MCGMCHTVLLWIHHGVVHVRVLPSKCKCASSDCTVTCGDMPHIDALRMQFQRAAGQARAGGGATMELCLLGVVGAGVTHASETSGM